MGGTFRQEPVTLIYVGLAMYVGDAIIYHEKHCRRLLRRLLKRQMFYGDDVQRLSYILIDSSFAQNVSFTLIKIQNHNWQLPSATSAYPVPNDSLLTGAFLTQIFFFCSIIKAFLILA